MSHDKQPISLHVIARSPFKLYFEGEATSVSAQNRVGAFDILAGHADFFSMLEPCDVSVVPVEGERVDFHINDGILTVRDNQAYLFVNL